MLECASRRRATLTLAAVTTCVGASSPSEVLIQMASETQPRASLLPGRAADTIKKDAGPVAFLVVVCLMFYSRFLGLSPFGVAHVPPGDLLNQFYPFRAYYASEIWLGRLPLWNPYVFAGHPFLADPQSSSLYPLNFLTALLLGKSGLSLVSLLWQITVAHMLAAIFTYYFIKQLTGNRFGAIIGSTMFALGGFLTSYPVQQLSILETAIWLPLILYLVERGIASHTRSVPTFALAGVALALSYLVGHPQTAMLNAYASVLYLILRSLPEKSAWRHTAIQCTTLLGVTLGISAAQLLPTLELFSISTRTQTSFEGVSQGYDFGSLIGMLIPGWRDELALYAGGVTPAVLLLAPLTPNARRYLAITIVGLLALALAMGRHTPFFQLLYTAVPGFALFRHQERAIYVFALAVCVVAAAGCSLLYDRRTTGTSKATLSLAGTLAALTIATAAWLISGLGLQAQMGLQSNPVERVTASYVFAAATITIAALLIIATTMGRLRGNTSKILLLSLVVFDVLAVNSNSNVSSDGFHIPAGTLAALEFVQSQEGVFRIRVEDDHVLPANYPALFGLQHVGGDTPMQIARVQRLLSQANEWKLWQLFNVRYVLSRRHFDEGVKQVYEKEGLRVYEVSYGLPRAYAVRQYVVARDAEEEFEITISPEIQPGDKVVLTSTPTLPPSSTVEQRPEVEILNYEPHRIRISTDGADDSILVVGDPYYHGWRTFVERCELLGQTTPSER